jgi:RNA polymerase sigma-70 factor (ECF subfamily)
MEHLKPLFTRIAVGDVIAFNEVYDSYHPVLLPYIERIIENNHLAQEIVHDVFVKLWEKGTSLKEVLNPEGWLRDVSCKISINYYRQEQRRRQMMSDIEQGAATVSGYEEIDFRFLRSLLGKGIKQLPGEYRRLVRLHLEQGKGRRQLARELNLPEKNIRSKLEQAWRLLREFIREHIGIFLFMLLLLAVLRVFYPG